MRPSLRGVVKVALHIGAGLRQDTYRDPRTEGILFISYVPRALYCVTLAHVSFNLFENNFRNYS